MSRDMVTTLRHSETTYGRQGRTFLYESTESGDQVAPVAALSPVVLLPDVPYHVPTPPPHRRKTTPKAGRRTVKRERGASIIRRNAARRIGEGLLLDVFG